MHLFLVSQNSAEQEQETDFNKVNFIFSFPCILSYLYVEKLTKLQAPTPNLCIQTQVVQPSPQIPMLAPTRWTVHGEASIEELHGQVLRRIEVTVKYEHLLEELPSKGNLLILVWSWGRKTCLKCFKEKLYQLVRATVL